MQIYNSQLKGISTGSTIITSAQALTDVGYNIFVETTGSILYLKSLIPGNNITLSSSSVGITINSTASGSTGSGSTSWGQITGSLPDQTDLQNELTSLSGSIVNRELLSNKSTNTSLGTSNTLYPTQNAVKVYVDTNISASSSITTASNLGTGLGLYEQKVGGDLQFKSLIAGNNITLSSSSVGITINSTASGSTSGSVTYNYILPAFGELKLLSSSSVFSASNLGITLFEDCSVIKAHDGLYYMFLDEFTGVTNNDVYCVSSTSPLFTSPTYIGKVITRPLSRVGSVIYLEDTLEYVMYITDRDTPCNGIYAYSIPRNDFPSGTWTNVGKVLTTGSVYTSEAVNMMGNILKDKSGMYLYPFSRVLLASETLAWWNFAYSDDPKTPFIEFPGNPILTEYPTDAYYDPTVSKGGLYIRAIYSVSNGYLCFYEAQNTAGTYWFVGGVFLDQSFKFIHEVKGSPLFISNNQSFANPNSFIVDMTAQRGYLYYQSSSSGLGSGSTFQNQHVAEFILNGV